MTWLAAALGGGLWLTVLVLLAARAWRQHGRVEAELAHETENDKSRRTAALVRDRLRHDADFASRVRARFTR